VFSFCDGADIAIQDLQGLFRHQFPNSSHDQYLQVVQIFDIQEIDKSDLELRESRPVPVVEDKSLDQNLKDFLSLDHSQIFATMHQPPIFEQRMLELRHNQQVDLDFLPIPKELEGR
jgi:hypothetical protein